jgi:polysaccharide biosynthesis/export protein
MRMRIQALLPVALIGVAALLTGCGASLNSDATAELASGAAKPGTPKATTAAALGGGGAATPIPASPEKTAALKAVEKATAASQPGSDGYKIGAQDTLEISVFKVPELSKVVQVADNGAINLPLLGDKYLNNPQVSVLIKEYNSQRVTVDGAVKKPGMYPLRGNTTLMQVIAGAEGINTEVASSEIVVIRNTSGKKSAAKFEIEDIRSGKIEDPKLVAGDYIMVETSAAKTAMNNLLKAVPLATVFRPF